MRWLARRRLAKGSPSSTEWRRHVLRVGDRCHMQEVSTCCEGRRFAYCFCLLVCVCFASRRALCLLFVVVCLLVLFLFVFCVSWFLFSLSFWCVCVSFSSLFRVCFALRFSSLECLSSPSLFVCVCLVSGLVFRVVCVLFVPSVFVCSFRVLLCFVLLLPFFVRSLYCSFAFADHSFTLQRLVSALEPQKKVCVCVCVLCLHPYVLFFPLRLLHGIAV